MDLNSSPDVNNYQLDSAFLKLSFTSKIEGVTSQYLKVLCEN